MNLQGEQVSALYKDVSELCSDGHVMLVQNQKNGEFYVKKCLESYHLSVYERLMKNPVKNTPAIYEIFPAEKKLVVIEEYIFGTTIAETLVQKGRFSEKQTRDIAMQLCVILKQLHAFSPAVIHRDIKPSNVMLAPDGTVKLLDFNAAKPEDAQKARDTTLIGTVGFAAPEQYGFAPASVQTDIYAMGVLMNVMLTGELPEKEAAGGKLKTIIRKCLEMNPKDRYRDIGELFGALKRSGGAGREWFPPGFRTMRPYKMLLAVAGYAFIAFSFTQFKQEYYADIYETYIYRIGFTSFELMLVLFYCNYLGVQRFFPFMKAKKKSVRIFGMILAPIILFWMMIIFLVAFAWMYI